MTKRNQVKVLASRWVPGVHVPAGTCCTETARYPRVYVPGSYPSMTKTTGFGLIPLWVPKSILYLGTYPSMTKTTRFGLVPRWVPQSVDAPGYVSSR